MNDVESTAEREEFRRKYADYSKYGKKFEKAVDTVLAGGVKENRFVPSGRKIFTVVGNLGDEFIDPERPYCSCGHFFFRVRTKKDELCYHLLSYKIASLAGKVDVTKFSDEEYQEVVAATVRDVLNVLDRSCH